MLDLVYFKLIFRRSVHFKPGQGYNCIPCQISFTYWKNFRRHGREKHGGSAKLSCSLCPYSSRRNHDLVRHQKIKHQSFKIVSILLDSLLSTVVEGINVDASSVTTTVPTSVTSEVASSATSEVTSSVSEAAPVMLIFEYERRRNERVAAFKAEFDERYPSFEKEVRSLKAMKTALPRKKKLPCFLAPARRSGRILCQVQELSNLVDHHSDGIAPDLVDLEAQEEVMETILLEDHDEITDAGGTEDYDDASKAVLVADLDEGLVSEVHEEMVTDGGDTEVYEEDAEESNAGDLLTGEGEAGDIRELGKHACLPCGLAFR